MHIRRLDESLKRRNSGRDIKEADMHCAREDDWPSQDIPRACGGSRTRQLRDTNAAEHALCFSRRRTVTHSNNYRQEGVFCMWRKAMPFRGWAACTQLKVRAKSWRQVAEAAYGHRCKVPHLYKEPQLYVRPVQRPSAVRINLNGDVPSVPIPLAKRKPSLKQPAGGHRVSLYAPEKRTPAIERSGSSSIWSFLNQQKSQASLSAGSTAGSHRFSQLAIWVFGKQKVKTRRRAVAG